MSPTKLSGGHKNTDDKKKPLSERKEQKRGERGHVTYDHAHGEVRNDSVEKTQNEKKKK